MYKAGGRLSLACSLWTPGVGNCQVHQQYSMSFIPYKAGTGFFRWSLFSKSDMFLGSSLNMLQHKAESAVQDSDENCGLRGSGNAIYKGVQQKVGTTCISCS